jgi:hypothetical protein
MLPPYTIPGTPPEARRNQTLEVKTALDKRKRKIKIESSIL